MSPPRHLHRSPFRPRAATLALLAAAATQLSCLDTIDGGPVNLAGQQVRLTFLQTSDIHSRLIPYDFNPVKTDTDLGLIPEAGPFGGATRLASLIKRERKRSDRVLHIDTGDSFQGAPIFNLNLGEVEYRFLTLVKTDAAAIGNHEFDMGSANFTKQARDAARFPILASNYRWGDTTQADSNATAIYTQPYTVTNVGGVRVGIIGVGNISSLNSIVEGGNSLQATPLEPNEAVRGWVEFLRPMVDVMVITSHAGLTEDQELIEGYEAFYEYGAVKAYLQRAADPWTVLEWFGPQGVDSSVVRVRIPGVAGVDVVLGGHLHVVLNPPQQLTDPRGRKVLLSHGGAFSKYLIRLDTVVQFPAAGESRFEGAEVVSSDFQVFPIDSLWCSEALHAYYQSQFWNPGDFIKDQKVRAGVAECVSQEDLDTTQLLLPYLTDLDVRLNLTSIFSYAPVDIMRRNNSTGGDSPLGNITADSMRVRQGVEAEVAVTNSLGIRDNLYAGPLTQEEMFNVFPFENTINIMFLSGRELQEMFDFVTDRSTERGCASQAQISGARFTMDCAQSQLNALRMPCDPAGTAAECPSDGRQGRAPWQCIEDSTLSGGGRCWAHGATNITISGQPLALNETYRIAVNDYIARGGSGFLVLKRNTTRVETGISLRDSLVGYMENFCTCEDLLAGRKDEYGNLTGAKGQPCGTRDPTLASRWLVDPQETAYCTQAKAFSEALQADHGGCSCADIFRRVAGCEGGTTLDAQVASCAASLPPGPGLGRCSCRQALAGDPLCGNVTRPARNFCEQPLLLPVALGAEDGRITRRVK